MQMVPEALLHFMCLISSITKTKEASCLACSKKRMCQHACPFVPGAGENAGQILSAATGISHNGSLGHSA